MKLNNQVAIIVGSARGIGAAIAHTFSREGAKIVLVDLEKTRPQLDGLAQAIAGKAGKPWPLPPTAPTTLRLTGWSTKPSDIGGE